MSHLLHTIYYCVMYIPLCDHYGLWSKYDLVGHYSTFVARILLNYEMLLCYIPQLYCMQTKNLPLKGELPY